MKCVKNLTTGEIKRVDDQTADRMCKNPTMYWFAPKSEWKAQNRKPVVVENAEKPKKKTKKVVAKRK
jgi:hypothetical protein